MRKRWPSRSCTFISRVPPWHVGRRQANDRPALLVLLMERVDVVHENGHPGAGLSLPAFAEEDTDLSALNAAECRRSAPVPLLGESELVDVVIHRHGEVLDIQDGDGTFEFVHGEVSCSRKIISSAPLRSWESLYGAHLPKILMTDARTCHIARICNQFIFGPIEYIGMVDLFLEW
jgi:hypothetical protein